MKHLARVASALEELQQKTQALIVDLQTTAVRLKGLQQEVEDIALTVEKETEPSGPEVRARSIKNRVKLVYETEGLVAAMKDYRRLVPIASAKDAREYLDIIQEEMFREIAVRLSTEFKNNT